VTKRPINIILIKNFRHEKKALLEFLESSICGMVDKISEDNVENHTYTTWVFDSGDI
tara:strand:+ start:756 stop:926 length:171 start_codon:yes stop_codon:yes gene_type:complete